MKKAIVALYAQEANGNWEVRQTRGPAEENSRANGTQWTGITAITTYALLCSGESKTDSRLTSAIDFLIANPSQGVYASSARCLVWSRIELTPARHAAAQRDVDYLLRAMRTKGDAKGLFFYTIPVAADQTSYDHSASQMAALGLSVMVPLGFEIPQDFWRQTERGWQAHQLTDGSWGYGPIYNHGVSSMTASGVATLFITQQLLADRSDCTGGTNDPHIDNGLNWLAANFDATFDASRETGKHHLEQYALFAISRVGFASGLRYFGKEDWYQRGAEYLLRTQQPNGNWVSDRPASTALGLLCLAYGSSPVVLNKLEYALPAEAGKPAVARWNQRPQDLSNFTEWMGHQLETRLNWQVVNLSSTVEALHDAPILVIAGSQALSFAEKERTTLRQFVEEGGLIVGNADCDNAAFSQSFQKLGKELFPAYAFRELPVSHPIYANEQYRAAKFRRPPHVLGLSNGVRELMLLPTGDLSRAFQRRSDVTQPDFYHLFDDIVLYAMDTSGLSRKGNSYIVQEAATTAPAARTIKLARLQYDGNWDPEPGGWRRLKAILHNGQKITMDVEPVTLGDGKLITPPAPAETSVAKPSDKQIRQTATKRIPPADLAAAMADDPQKAEAMIDGKIKEVRAELDAAGEVSAAGRANFTLAHLTGTAALKLTDAERGDLKKFVDSGGTLIIDAAGGSTEFAASAEQMLLDTFGSAAKQIESPLTPDAPMYRQTGHLLDQVQYRHFARSRVGATMPQLRGIQVNGRIAIIYSREDLSAGLVGEPVDGVTGYTPASATELMTDIILYLTHKSHPQ